MLGYAKQFEHSEASFDNSDGFIVLTSHSEA